MLFAEKRFLHDPKHCKTCKATLQRLRASAARAYTVVCEQCKESTTVPFLPTQGKPVFCRECFQLRQRYSAHIPEIHVSGRSPVLETKARVEEEK